MGFFRVIPASHALYLHWGHPHISLSLGYELLMSLLYTVGAGFYVSRIPERWKPGAFDIACQSHQIFHALHPPPSSAHPPPSHHHHPIFLHCPPSRLHRSSIEPPSFAHMRQVHIYHLTEMEPLNLHLDGVAQFAARWSGALEDGAPSLSQ
ncbi:hypothetical protein Dsin_009931 [Dipteronia sinensis]|uniref:Uncharacterized protein n=1 Tax=Dipteronia sinensis TaxID=43782 RepID=A0AAE0EC70_9ROSI|nr:hypothetical protein Dsin_009931 [Dipteronia sinensis]